MEESPKKRLIDPTVEQQALAFLKDFFDRIDYSKIEPQEIIAVDEEGEESVVTVAPRSISTLLDVIMTQIKGSEHYDKFYELQGELQDALLEAIDLKSEVEGLTETLTAIESVHDPLAIRANKLETFLDEVIQETKQPMGVSDHGVILDLIRHKAEALIKEGEELQEELDSEFEEDDASS